MTIPDQHMGVTVSVTLDEACTSTEAEELRAKLMDVIDGWCCVDDNPDDLHRVNVASAHIVYVDPA